MHIYAAVMQFCNPLVVINVMHWSDKIGGGINQCAYEIPSSFLYLQGSQEGLYNYYKLNTRIGGEPEWLRASKKCKG